MSAKINRLFPYPLSLASCSFMKTLPKKILFFLLCVLIVATTLFYGTVHQPVIAVFYIAVSFVLILWALDGFLSGRARFNTNLLQIPVFAVALYGIFQIIPFGTIAQTAGVENIPRTISLDPFNTQVAAFHFIALGIIFSAFLAFTNNLKRLKQLFWVITIFGFMFAFFAILQGVLSPKKIYGLYDVSFGSPYGSFVNRHDFAAIIEMAIALPLGLMFAGAVEKDRRLLFITGIGLMGIALILSGSRGGLFALLAEVIFLIILTAKTKSKKQFALKIGLAAALFITIITGSILIGGESSLTRIAERASSEDFSSSRFHIWSVTLQSIRANLPFGAGLGAFGAAYTPFDTTNGMETVEQSHNDYLQVLADMGIVGAIIGAFFLFRFFKTGFQSIKVESRLRRGIALGAFAGCFAVLIHSIFDFVLHITAISVMFLALLALLVGSGDKPEDEIDDENHGRHRKRRSSSQEQSAKILPMKRKVRRSSENGKLTEVKN